MIAAGILIWIVIGLWYTIENIGDAFESKWMSLLGYFICLPIFILAVAFAFLGIEITREK